MGVYRWLQSIFLLSFTMWIIFIILIIIHRPLPINSVEFIGMFANLAIWNVTRMMLNNIKRSMIIEEIIRDLKNV